MQEISSLTLYREKSTVHRLDDFGDGAKEEQVLEIRSNRIALPLKFNDQTYNCVLRGQNMPATLRLAGIVIDQFRRDPNMVHDAKDMDWGSRWLRVQSSYESNYNSALWITIHLDGEPVYASGSENDEVIDEIEMLADGGELSDDIINEASSNIVGALDDLVVEHDSQTAFVFSSFPTYYRAAVLERKNGKTGSFAVSTYHVNPKKPVRHSYFLGLAADIIEALTMSEFLQRVQVMVNNNSFEDNPITPAQVGAARNRRKDLLNQISSFEKTHKVTYRPERPTF